MDLENFLISNSKINKKFIKDFFGFQKTEQFKDYKPFTINLDDVAYWLESLKANLKNTLITSYIKDVDFIIIESLLIPNHEQSKHDKETIIITSDTFKMLCMRSKTKKADKIRKYYINLEKLIYEYKDIIINNLNTKIKVLENNLSQCGDVYIYEEIDQLNDKYIRIGSSNDVDKKNNLSSLDKKKVLYKIKTHNIKQFEKCLQTHFYNFKFKKNKDYYKISNDMIEKAIENCNGIIENFQNDIIENPNKTGGGKIKMIDMTPNQLNTTVKESLSFYSDNIMWNLYEKPEDAFYHGKKITKKRLNSIALDVSISNKLIILECQRASEYYRYLELKTKSYTYKEFFEELHKFYCNTKLTLEELKLIPNDFHDYVKDAIKEIKKNKKKIYLIDIMGSLCRFEKIYKVSNYDHVYRIFLGT